MGKFKELLELNDIQGSITLEAGPKKPKPEEPDESTFDSETITEPPAPTTGEPIPTEQQQLQQLIQEQIKQDVKTPLAPKPAEEEPEGDEFDQLAQGMFDAEDDIDRLARGMAMSDAEMYFKGIATGFADFLDLPGQVIGLGLDAMGGPYLTRGGFRDISIRNGMSPERGMEPDSMAWDMGTLTGATFASFPLMGMGSGLRAADITGKTFLRSIPGRAKNLIREGGRQVVQRPLRTAAFETGAAGVAGAVGFEAAEAFPEHPELAKFLGQLGGGIAGSLGVVGAAEAVKRTTRGTVRLAEKTPLLGIMVRGMKDMRAIFSPDGRLQRAREWFLANHVRDPEKALKNLDKKRSSPELEDHLSLFDKTEDPLIQALQESILAKFDEGVIARNEQLSAINQAIVDSLAAPEVASKVVRAAVADGVEAVKEYYEARIRTAFNELARRLKEMEPQMANMEPGKIRVKASEVAKQVFLDAWEDTHSLEKAYWAKLPVTVEGVGGARVVVQMHRAPIENFYMSAIMSDNMVYGHNARNWFPEIYSELFGGFNKKGKFVRGRLDKRGEFIRVDELKDLRTATLVAIRKELGENAPDEGKVALLRKANEAILEALEMEARNMDVDVSAPFHAAVRISRQAADFFDRGPIAQIFRLDKSGEVKIADSFALEKLLYVGGNMKQVKQAKAFDKAIEAIRFAGKEGPEGVQLPEKLSDPADLEWAVESWIKGTFLDNFVSGGKIDVPKAQKWLDLNRAWILENFPAITDDFEQAIRTQNLNTLLERRYEVRLNRLNDTKRSFAAIMMGEDPVKVFDRLAKSVDLDRDLAEVIKLVNAGDPSGDALDGLRVLFMDYILRNSRASTQIRREHVVSGILMAKQLNKPNIKRIAGRLLTPEQHKRLEAILDDAMVFEQRLEARPSVGGIIQDGTGTLLQLLTRVSFAQIGRRVAKMTGGGTVQTPGAFAKFGMEGAEAFIIDGSEKIIIEALLNNDEKVLRLLLTPIDSKETLKEVVSGLDAYMVAIMAEKGITIVEDFESAGDDPFEGALENERFLPEGAFSGENR